MRKVLLTTTALVALGGVSAASAIDISGSYGVEYYSESNTGGSADATLVSHSHTVDSHNHGAGTYSAASNGAHTHSFSAHFSSTSLVPSPIL